MPLKPDLSTNVKVGKSGIIEQLMTRRTLFGLGCLLSLVLLGVGAVFLTRGFGAERQLERMQEEVARLDSAKIRLVWRPGQGANGDQLSALSEVRVDGRVDLANPASPLADLQIELRPRLQGELLRVVWSIRVVEGQTWVRLDEAPDEVLSSLALSSVEVGVWQKGEGLEAFWDLVQVPLPWPGLSPEQIVAERRVVEEARLFSRPVATLTEVLHGRVTRLLTAEGDVLGAQAFVEAWNQVRSGSRSPEEQARDQVLASSFGSLRVNFWIDHVDASLHRVVMQWASGALLDGELSEHNVPVDISDPLKEMLPAAKEEARTWSADVALDNQEVRKTEGVVTPGFPTPGDADGDGLSDDLETFYGSRPDVWDTDGDGFSDGEEVNNGYNPVGPGRLFDFGLVR